MRDSLSTGLVEFLLQLENGGSTRTGTKVKASLRRESWLRLGQGEHTERDFADVIKAIDGGDDPGLSRGGPV